jgi:hypothetical protein
MTYRQKANILEALLSLVKEDPKWMEEETTSRDAIDAASIWLKELNAIASASELDLFEEVESWFFPVAWDEAGVPVSYEELTACQRVELSKEAMSRKNMYGNWSFFVDCCFPKRNTVRLECVNPNGQFPVFYEFDINEISVE